MKGETPEDELQGLARRLKQAREFLNLSQAFVAEQTGIPRSAVSDIERGARRVDSIELKRLSALYRLTPEYLLSGAEGVPQEDATVAALARATKQMTPDEQDEVLRFALFLRNFKKPPAGE